MEHYNILGVTPSSTDEEIKKQYKKLALKWHPDRHPAERKVEAEQKMKQINEAYRILTTSSRTTPVFAAKHENDQEFAFRIFDVLFNIRDFPFAAAPTNPLKKVMTHRKTIKLGLKDFYYGVTKKYKIVRKRLSGSDEKIEVNVCFPIGTRVDDPIKVVGIGDEFAFGKFADIQFFPYYDPDETPEFQWDGQGNDLNYCMILTDEQSRKGFSKKIKTVDGKKIKITIDKPIQDGDTTEIVGKGMSFYQYYTHEDISYGDLIVTFAVK